MNAKCAVAVIGLVACGAPAMPQSTPATKGELKMKAYTLVLLRRGPAWTADDNDGSKIISEGHMSNIDAMAKAGKLVLAGPIDADAADAHAIAGIFVLDADRPEVEKLLNNDPAITSHRLVPELLPWYGPAGITFPGSLAPR